MHMRTRGALLTVGAVVLAMSAPASAQESADAGCSGPTDHVQVTSGNARFAQTFVVQNGGQISSAQVTIDHQSGVGDYVIALVDAPGGIPGQTTLASVTVPDASIPGGPNVAVTATFPAPLPVNSGEQYAVMITRPGSTDLTVRDRIDNPCPGALFLAGAPPAPYSAIGFGQSDMLFTIFVSPRPPEPQAGDASAPDTTITDGPPPKTKKKSATIAFSGTDARAVASFQCKLDDDQFEACMSPKTYSRLKKGKHTVEVRAVDAAGNVDPTPASRSWKIKKKRKKK